jgi:hypothetical protein
MTVTLLVQGHLLLFVVKMVKLIEINVLPLVAELLLNRTEFVIVTPKTHPSKQL